MEWAYIFNTFSRRGYGQFYLDFTNAVHSSFFENPDNPFVIAMVGARGKSLAADVVFHSLLDHLDPMDIIAGKEVRHMYLEDKPKDAIHRPLFDHGLLRKNSLDGDNISLMFVNQPIPEILDKDYYKRDIEERDAIIAQCLRNAFNRGRKGHVGGLIFASGFGTFDCADVTFAMEGGTHNNWEAEHTVYINSESLRQSKKFQENWMELVARYKAKSALQSNI